MLLLHELKSKLDLCPTNRVIGRVRAVQGTTILAEVPQARIGDLVQIDSESTPGLRAQVVAFNGELVTLAPLGDLFGISPGAHVAIGTTGVKLKVPADPRGQILNCLGEPLLGANPGSFAGQSLELDLFSKSPEPLKRKKISTIMHSGVPSIDALCPVGHGQRIGLFSAAGTGKSTLLGRIARNAEVEITIVALVGERGREVNEFIYESLGEVGLQKSVVVVSTSDESALRRALAAYTATAIAEQYRDRGKKVLLLVDSLTRVARAHRDVALGAGEIPVRHGFPSSVFTNLPKLLERSGNNHLGSITAIYTVLSSEEQEYDPLSEEIKSLLDGHLILSTKLAEQGIRPAIDFSTSISRLIPNTCTTRHQQMILRITKLISRIKHDRDLALLGGAADPELNLALKLEPKVIALLNQTGQENHSKEEYLERFYALANEFEVNLAD